MSDEGAKAAERPAAAAAAEPAVEAVADGGLSPKEVAVAARKLRGDVRNKAKDLAETLLKVGAMFHNHTLSQHFYFFHMLANRSQD